MAEGAPTLTNITIDSIDVSSYILNWTLDDSGGSDFIRTIRISLSKSVNNIISIDTEDIIGKEIIVYRGNSSSTEYTVLRGVVIKKIEFGNQLELRCADKLYLTTKRTVTYSFDKDIDTEAGVISDIFTTLINDYTDLTADATSVQESGTTNILSKFICKSEKVYDKLKLLAETLGWVFYYNSNEDKVYFEPKGFVDNSTTIQNNVNLVETPEWDTDESSVFNEVRVDGAQQEVQTTETGQIGVTTGYSISSIQLNYIPIAIRVLCDAANPPTTEKTLGVPNSTLVYDYYGDKVKKQIIWNTSTYTPGAADFVIVQYTYMKPVPIQVDDIDSIDTYGIRQKTITKKELTEVSDAEVYAKQYISNHKNPVLSTTLKVTNIKDIDIGQQIRVIDFNNNIDAFFKIEKIKMVYPYKFDEVTVTSEILDESNYTIEVNKRVEQLEKQNLYDFETLIQIKTLRDATIAEDRYLEIEQGDIESGVLYWDNDSQGTWGNNAGSTGYDWGDDNDTVLTSVAIIQSEKKYIELFYDTDFKQTTGFTADWDTTNKYLIIKNTELALSTAICKATTSSTNNLYTKARILSITGTNVDNLTYQIGEDNDSSITYTTIATTGSTTNRISEWIYLTNTNKYGINWKIINSSGSTGTLTYIALEYDIA